MLPLVGLALFTTELSLRLMFTPAFYACHDFSALPDDEKYKILKTYQKKSKSNIDLVIIV